MKDKFNLLFKPFLIVFFGLIIGYTFFNWLIFIELELFHLKEMVTNFVIPSLLVVVIAWIFLWPGLKMLKLDRKQGNWRDLYFFVLCMALIIPLLITQEYAVTATGRLTRLNSIQEINGAKPTRFYTVKNYYIDKNNIGVHSAFEVSGRHSEDFDMHLYFALPIFEKASDTIDATPVAWLGVAYKRTISNRIKSAEKEGLFDRFANNSQKEFERKNVSDFVYLSRLRHSDEREGFMEAIAENKAYKPNQIILESVNEPFEARNGDKLAWILGTSLAGSLVFLILLSIPKINDQELKRIKAGKTR